MSATRICAPTQSPLHIRGWWRNGNSLDAPDSDHPAQGLDPASTPKDPLVWIQPPPGDPGATVTCDHRSCREVTSRSHGREASLGVEYQGLIESHAGHNRCVRRRFENGLLGSGSDHGPATAVEVEMQEPLGMHVLTEGRHTRISRAQAPRSRPGWMCETAETPRTCPGSTHARVDSDLRQLSFARTTRSCRSSSPCWPH